jgi:tetraacyldisaccharide 4'-kinase
LETYIRSSWSGRPGPLLRLAGATFGLGIAARHRLYDAGLLRTRVPALPVISVGGVTVGGSGKTPVAAEIVGWIAEKGLRVGVATHGFSDEMEVHRRLNPGVMVGGARDRHGIISELADRGCQVVVLDDGFQRRQLARDLDIVVIDAETAASTAVRYLPAGPYRERLEELRRVAGIVVTRRVASASTAAEVRTRFERRFPDAAVGVVGLRPGRLIAANEAAACIASPAPAVAVAAIMKADLALAQMCDRIPTLVHTHAFSDHARFDPKTVEELIVDAGSAGVVGTLKDVVKLGPIIGAATPVWYVSELLVWEANEAALRERLADIAALARSRTGGRRGVT